MDLQKQKDDWEKLWKKFSSILGYLYDNQGVLQSLEKQKSNCLDEKASHALDEQIKEIDQLIQTHQKDLSIIIAKSKAIIKKSKAFNEKDFIFLEKAIEDSDFEHIKQLAKKIEKSFT